MALRKIEHFLFGTFLSSCESFFLYATLRIAELKPWLEPKSLSPQNKVDKDGGMVLHNLLKKADRYSNETIAHDEDNLNQEEMIL